jgi:cytochrome c oxidase subunit I
VWVPVNVRAQKTVKRAAATVLGGFHSLLAAPAGRSLAVPHPGSRFTGGVWNWLTTVDHKRIGKLYLFTALTFFLIGGIEAGVMRAQLAGANLKLVSAETYNQLFTMHGTTMIFLAVMPLAAAFFNFLIPLQIGARDVAFPRLNAFSYWVYLFGGLLITLPILFNAAPNGGWFNYAPLSTRQYSPGINIDFWAVGIQILGLSTLAASFNFITTIINLRAPGMTLMRMPQFTWNAFVVQFLVLLSFPVLTIGVQFLILDRFFGTAFYAPAGGGDPLLWQHVFWIFGHPEVYILILPAFGLTSEVVPTFSRKPLFGYASMIYATILIGFLAFGVWAHHMFAVGMGPVADAAFGVTSMLIAIPTGVKIFNWLATMWGGALRFTTPMLFAIGLVSAFPIGGISGVMHTVAPVDLQQTDTYFVVAHIHYVLFAGSMFGMFAGLYHYYPKMFGRLMNDRLGKWHFWLTLVGTHLTFFPMHFAGMYGMPRRIYTYDAGQGFTLFNSLATAGYGILFVGMLIFVYNFLRSLSRGARCDNDPWGGATLEWSIPSPPPDYNFAELPRVTSAYPLWEIKPDGAGRAASVNARRGLNAEALGIPMPRPSPLPLLCAAGVVVMFAGLFFVQASPAIGAAIIIAGALGWISALYAWLMTPLEKQQR